MKAPGTLAVGQPCLPPGAASVVTGIGHQVLHAERLAARYTEPARTALVITHGISGSGKTTHSQHFMDAFGLVRVRADVERKRLYGLAATQSSAGIPGGIYSAAANARVQDRLEALAETVLQAGFPVLVDATFIRRAPRERMARLARKMQRLCLLLAFVAPTDVLRTRVVQRSAEGRDASEADTAVVDKQLAVRNLREVKRPPR